MATLSPVANSMRSELVDQGRVAAVITQNVDNLHQDSGVPADRVIELHGNARYAKCLGCDAQITLESVEAEYRESGSVGPCASCGGGISGHGIPEQGEAGDRESAADGNGFDRLSGYSRGNR